MIKDLSHLLIAERLKCVDENCLVLRLQRQKPTTRSSDPLNRYIINKGFPLINKSYFSIKALIRHTCNY